jgi:nucleoside-diphosphate-sugar epimerase
MKAITRSSALISRALLTPTYKYFSVDMRDYKSLKDAVQETQPDLIFHLAGLTRGSEIDIYNVNFMGGLHLLNSVRETAPQGQIMIVGSAAEYGSVDERGLPIIEDHPCNPKGAYGLSKYALTLAAQDYVRRFGMNVVVTRPFNIIGADIPSTLVIGAIIQRAKQALLREGELVISVGNLDGKRDFISVQDVIEGYLGAIRSEKWGEIFNICSGESRSIRSVVELLLSFSERPIQMQFDRQHVGVTEVNESYGSWEKASRTFGFKPNTDLEKCLRETWDYSMRPSASLRVESAPIGTESNEASANKGNPKW